MLSAVASEPLPTRSGSISQILASDGVSIASCSGCSPGRVGHHG